MNHSYQRSSALLRSLATLQAALTIFALVAMSSPLMVYAQETGDTTQSQESSSDDETSGDDDTSSDTDTDEGDDIEETDSDGTEGDETPVEGEPSGDTDSELAPQVESFSTEGSSSDDEPSMTEEEIREEEAGMDNDFESASIAPSEEDDFSIATFGHLKPKLKIKKELVNDNGGTAATSSFSFKITKHRIILPDQSITVPMESDGTVEVFVDPTLNLGPFGYQYYTVEEVSATGYTTTYQNCEDLEFGYGDKETCTVKNDDVMPEGPMTSTVTLCKVKENETFTGLPGWTLMLMGAQVGTTNVNPDGTNYTISDVAAGDYIVRAEGTYTYRPNDPTASLSDAAFSLRLPSDPVYGGDHAPWVEVNTFPSPNTGWLGIMMNDAETDWGSVFNPDHLYALGVSTNSEQDFTFKILDDQYADNSGHLMVTMNKGFIGVTDGDGCVTFDDVPFGTYTLEEINQEGWSYETSYDENNQEIENEQTRAVEVNEEEERWTLMNSEESGNGNDDTATLHATKIVCKDESYLPNRSGGADITATTAAEFLAAVNAGDGPDVCWLEDGWQFEWVTDAESNVNPGNNVIGPVGGDWTPFGLTDVNGTVSTEIPAGGKVWVREVNKPGYESFSGSDDVSAEMWCSTDVLNYDNWDWVDPVNADTHYHCVAFNALSEEEEICVPGEKWADGVESMNQMKRKDGSDVLPARSDAALALGANDATFYSLGFGGSVVLSFENYIKNDTGDDLVVYETTNGTYPSETASIEVSQNGTTWFMLSEQAGNTAGGITSLDVAETGLTWFRYVRITDTSNPAVHQNDADGFDLNAIQGVYGVCEEPAPPTPTKATIVATKVMCDAEQYLPNSGQIANPITAGTAAAWVAASEGHCWLEDGYDFQWTFSTEDPADNGTEALGSPWTTFGSTDTNGVTSTMVTIPSPDVIKVREVLKTGDVQYANDESGAKFYCATDVAGVDNWEWINASAGNTYYCVAFNANEDADGPGGGNDEATITIIKKTDGEDGTFEFEIDGGDDVAPTAENVTREIETEEGEGEITIKVKPGTYEVTEIEQDGWTLVDAYCEFENDSDFQSAIAFDTEFTLEDGDEVTCTFVNSKDGEMTETFGTTTVRSANLETETNRFVAAMNNSGKWFFYNDLGDVINNSVGSFVDGPETAPAGEGSAQITAPVEVPETSPQSNQRYNLATYKFKDVKLADITQLSFSTYSHSAGNGSPSSERSAYLQFNVDFANNDTWQRRLIFLPSANGTVVNDEWQDWDAIDSGDGMWLYSGSMWPAGATSAGNVPGTTARSWDDILADYPNAETRSTDSWFGFRVGEPYADGFTGNVDNFKIGIESGSNTHIETYDFEPTELTSEGDDNDNDRGSTGNRVRSTASGIVLGATTECSPLLLTYLGRSYMNPSDEVTKLQNFLNTSEGANVPVTGAFDSATEAAVRIFQAKYWEDVLKPWFAFPEYGVLDSDDTTGIVYKTTQWKVNDLYCPGSQALPMLP